MSPQVQLAWISLISTIITAIQSIVLEWIRRRAAKNFTMKVAEEVSKRMLPP
jgi:hypothetical protein